MKQGSQINWPRLVISLVSLIAISFGLAYLFQSLGERFPLPLDKIAWLAYLIVFGTTLLCNFTIIAPVPLAASLMIAAATEWNPVMIALAASIGGTLGELSGYYAGYLGKKIAIAEYMAGYDRFAGWMHRYGMWAIFLLAFQPVIPFDIGGMIAGAARMPLRKFLPALWVGKFLKYVILCYSGIGLIQFLSF
jgi:membrane protein YqaA with SNARE-associated domain